MTHSHVSRLLAASALAGAVALLGACASTPPPSSELAVSTAAVAHAAGAGAPEGAPAEMRSARDKLARAQAASSSGDHDLARRLALEATAEAQLAEALTEAVRARKAVAELNEADRVLREEMARKARTPQ
ncbi:DUF4398 domain-containing protein [Rubrivivax sp. RP6-9]|uniref:DUF4398 domain-containing protein n=1 Tax=Rubrivivax sp. RP6-9 TaxID=3415750 RepID=UPI003CC63A44